MTEKGQTWKLIVGIGLMGLAGWSAFVSGAEPGSPACAAKVKGQVAALARKNGRNPSNNTQTNLLAKCSEAEVGVDLEGLFASHTQESASSKEARCQNSVNFAVANGLETSGRSNQTLVNLCLQLPSAHNAACGFPTNAETYSVVENQSCVSKAAGITTHGVMAKAEKVARKASGDAGEIGTGDGETSGAGSAQ